MTANSDELSVSSLTHSDAPDETAIYLSFEPDIGTYQKFNKPFDELFKHRQVIEAFHLKIRPKDEKYDFEYLISFINFLKDNPSSPLFSNTLKQFTIEFIDFFETPALTPFFAACGELVKKLGPLEELAFCFLRSIDTSESAEYLTFNQCVSLIREYRHPKTLSFLELKFHYVEKSHVHAAAEEDLLFSFIRQCDALTSMVFELNYLEEKSRFDIAMRLVAWIGDQGVLKDFSFSYCELNSEHLRQLCRNKALKILWLGIDKGPYNDFFFEETKQPDINKKAQLMSSLRDALIRSSISDFTLELFMDTLNESTSWEPEYTHADDVLLHVVEPLLEAKVKSIRLECGEEFSDYCKARFEKNKSNYLLETIDKGTIRYKRQKRDIAFFETQDKRLKVEVEAPKQVERLHEDILYKA